MEVYTSHSLKPTGRALGAEAPKQVKMQKFRRRSQTNALPSILFVLVRLFLSTLANLNDPNLYERMDKSA